MSRLEEIKEREYNATFGPWYVGKKIISMVRSTAFGNIAHCDLQGGPGNVGDAEFIAHARSDVPWLLERVSELEAENERIRDKVKAEHKHLRTKLDAARLHESEDADYLSGTEKALEWVLDQVLGTEC